MTKIGIIGGSGLYDMDGLSDRKWIDVATPWGDPSDQVLTGTLGDVDMVFLPRHGRGHVQTPTSINYRANIDVLKQFRQFWEMNTKLGIKHFFTLYKTPPRLWVAPLRPNKRFG